MRTLTVQAAPGMQVPREGIRGRFITDHTPVTVPSTPYYRRRIRGGELVTIAPAPAAPTTAREE